MRLFLKNYTSNVPVSKTVYEIEQTLIRCGITTIAKEYSTQHTGKIAALTFSLPIAEGARPVPIRLPVEEDKALQALWMNYVDGDELNHDGQTIQFFGKSGNKKKRRKDFQDQAERTAWRIMQDWVEIQMSMIQLNQADAMEVFLPYVWDGTRTYYQALRDSKFAGLLPETSS